MHDMSRPFDSQGVILKIGKSLTEAFESFVVATKGIEIETPV